MATDDARFEAVVARVAQSMPDAESAQSISQSFRSKWRQPPLAQIEQVLRRTTSLEDARRIVFYPDAEDMADYVVCLQRLPPGAPETHPLAKAQPLLLATLYTIHLQEQRLMRPFILAGGLRALVGLVDAENVYVASQALDCLLTLTELFDWHEDPPPDVPLLQCMGELARPDVRTIQTLGRCIDNRWPGCAAMALSVLAAWLSVVRYFFCRERVLRLGPDVLELLRRWSAREGAEIEELELAQKLYDDFRRFPLATREQADGVLSADGTSNIALPGAAAQNGAAPAADDGRADAPPADALDAPSEPPSARLDWRSDVMDDLD